MKRLMLSLIGAVAGLALLAAGLAVDAWLHAADETLAAREGVLALSNPGHAMLAAGLVMTGAGVLFALHAAWGLAGTGGFLARRWVRLVSIQAAGGALITAAIVTVGFSASQHDHSHAEDAQAADEADTALGAQQAVVDEELSDGEVPEPHSHAAAPLTDDGVGDGTAPLEDESAMAHTAAKHPQNHPEPTAEELACLADLTAQAKEQAAPLADYSVAQAEGYRPNPQNPTGTHHPNPAYQRDGVLFDLARPESLVYRNNADGTKTLLGVLFHAPRGQGPTPCGNATWWHTHDACVDPATRTPTPAPADGACPDGTIYREAQVEMLHLWFVPRKRIG